MSSYLNSRNVYNSFQTAYYPGISTETPFLKKNYNLFLSLDKGNKYALVLLDISSSFGAINYSVLVHRLHTEFAFTDIVLTSNFKLCDLFNYTVILLLIDRSPLLLQRTTSNYVVWHLSLIPNKYFLLLWSPSITDDDDFLFNVEDTTRKGRIHVLTKLKVRRGCTVPSPLT